jgi:hypothetical protein
VAHACDPLCKASCYAKRHQLRYLSLKLFKLAGREQATQLACNGTQATCIELHQRRQTISKIFVGGKPRSGVAQGPFQLGIKLNLPRPIDLAIEAVYRLVHVDKAEAVACQHIVTRSIGSAHACIAAQVDQEQRTTPVDDRVGEQRADDLRTKLV